MRVGIAHHFGWAVAVTATATYEVVDRRRIELIEPGIPAAPIHSDSTHLDDDETSALVAQVRASAQRATAASLAGLAAEVPGAIVSMSLRRWPADFPTDIAVLRRSPYEARADSVMYREVLADEAGARGWDIRFFDAKDVEREAEGIVGRKVNEILHAPRAALGAPWTKDHRMAFAATIIAG